VSGTSKSDGSHFDSVSTSLGEHHLSSEVDGTSSGEISSSTSGVVSSTSSKVSSASSEVGSSSLGN